MGHEPRDEYGKDVLQGQEIQPGPHRLAGRADQEVQMQKILQEVHSQQEQCTEAAEEMPQGLQVRCARIIMMMHHHALMSHQGPV
jgi:hypothetical protein